MKNHILHTGKVGSATSTGGTWGPENQDPKISMEPGTQNIQVRFGIQDPKSGIWNAGLQK